MSDVSKFSVREWLVPPVPLPIVFVLLIAAAMLIQMVVPFGGPRTASSSERRIRANETSPIAVSLQAEHLVGRCRG